MPDSNAKRAVKVALSSLLWATDRVRSRIPGLASVHGRGVVLLYHSIPERDRERFGRQLDALVALTPENAHYLAGFGNYIATHWRLPGLFAVAIGPNGRKPPLAGWLAVVTLTTDTVAGLAFFFPAWA